MLEIIGVPANSSPVYKVKFPKESEDRAFIMLSITEEDQKRLFQGPSIAQQLREFRKQPCFEALPLSIQELLIKMAEVQQQARCIKRSQAS